MHVFLVHGYLAPGRLLWPISKRLEQAGFSTTLFDYPSRRGSLDEHAHALARRVEATADVDSYGFVGHSLGGLVIRRALELLGAPAERAVFIATPHQGCALGRRLRASPLGRWISEAGRLTARGLDGPVLAHSIGTIAGRNDRTVTPAEASLDGVESLVLPFSHNELLLRRRTANAVVRFFEHNSFEVELDQDAMYAQMGG